MATFIRSSRNMKKRVLVAFFTTTATTFFAFSKRESFSFFCTKLFLEQTLPCEGCLYLQRLRLFPKYKVSFFFHLQKTFVKTVAIDTKKGLAMLLNYLFNYLIFQIFYLAKLNGLLEKQSTNLFF